MQKWGCQTLEMRLQVSSVAWIYRDIFVPENGNHLSSVRGGSDQSSRVPVRWIKVESFVRGWWEICAYLCYWWNWFLFFSATNLPQQLTHGTSNVNANPCNNMEGSNMNNSDSEVFPTWYQAFSPLSSTDLLSAFSPQPHSQQDAVKVLPLFRHLWNSMWYC